MQEKLLKEYVAVEAKFKALEQEKKELREAILNELQRNHLDKVESDKYGTFTVGSRVSWAYSPLIERMQQKLALAKAKEVKRGIATVESETKYVVFTPVTKE